MATLTIIALILGIMAIGFFIRFCISWSIYAKLKVDEKRKKEESDKLEAELYSIYSHYKVWNSDNPNLTPVYLRSDAYKMMIKFARDKEDEEDYE